MDKSNETMQDYQGAVKVAMEHLDSIGVPEDAEVTRGLVRIHILCNMQPVMRFLMFEMYPGNHALTQ